MGVLDLILDSLGLTSVLGGRTKRHPEFYLEAPVLKEMFKVSLRYAENIMILGGRAQKSTLSCWNHNRPVKDVLKAIFEMLRLVGYEYTVLDSTNFMDWRKGAHEAFTSMRVRLGEAIFPIHVEAATSEVKFTEGLPPSSSSLMEHSTLSPS